MCDVIICKLQQYYLDDKDKRGKGERRMYIVALIIKRNDRQLELIHLYGNIILKCIINRILVCATCFGIATSAGLLWA
jgi:hypothetical protein